MYSEPDLQDTFPADEDYTPVEVAAWAGFLMTYGRVRRRLDAEMQAKYHLSPPEFEVLCHLSRHGEGQMRLSDLAAKSVLTASGISRLIARLEGMGLITRHSAPEDRRGAYAVLTQVGWQRAHDIRMLDVANVRRYFLSLYSEDELETMTVFWTRLLGQPLDSLMPASETEQSNEVIDVPDAG